MLCCGKKKKKDVKKEKEVNYNCGFVGEENSGRDSTQNLDGSQDSGKGNVQQENTHPHGKLKGILQPPDKKSEETTEEGSTTRKRTRTVSFSLPDEDLLVDREQLNAVLEAADRVELEEAVKEMQHTEVQECEVGEGEVPDLVRMH